MCHVVRGREVLFRSPDSSTDSQRCLRVQKQRDRETSRAPTAGERVIGVVNTMRHEASAAGGGVVTLVKWRE